MRTLLFVALIGIAMVAFAQQQTSQRFEPATITSVEEQKNPAMKEDGTGRQYKLGLRTASRSYVVLFTPAYGSRSVEYGVGQQISILVEKKTIRFNDISGNSMSMPILSTEKLEPKAAPH